MQNNSKSKNILLIITGSVAAYKAVDLIRKLQKNNRQVRVILTKSAQKFITKMLISSIAGKENLYEEIFDENDPMSHISLSRKSDLVVIAPATANFLTKIANGTCDDLASAVVAACDKKVMIAPAMNKEMWSNEANLQNLEKIANNPKIHLINPVEDILACQELGIGKMESCENILTKIEEYFQFQESLSSFHFIITGGGTREAIDSVRYIGNASSGKQAIEIAHFARFCGAEVSFIAANIDLPINIEKERLYRVKSCDEMHKKVKELVESANNDKAIFISCAAVADFKPKSQSLNKIKKDEKGEIDIKLIKNVDILHEIGNLDQKRPKIVIGFAAEDEKDLIANAKKKLKVKNCDIVVANDIESGMIFNNINSKAYLIDDNNTDHLGKISKAEVAKRLIERIIKII